MTADSTIAKMDFGSGKGSSGRQEVIVVRTPLRELCFKGGNDAEDTEWVMHIQVRRLAW